MINYPGSIERQLATPSHPARSARTGAPGELGTPARERLLWLQRHVGNRATLQRSPATAGLASPIPAEELLRHPAIDRIRAALLVLPDEPARIHEPAGSRPAARAPTGPITPSAGPGSAHQQLIDAINEAISPVVGPLPPALAFLVAHGVQQLVRKGTSYVLDSALGGMDDQSHAAVRNAVQAALRINVWTF